MKSAKPVRCKARTSNRRCPVCRKTNVQDAHPFGIMGTSTFFGAPSLPSAAALGIRSLTGRVKMVSGSFVVRLQAVFSAATWVLVSCRCWTGGTPSRDSHKHGYGGSAFQFKFERIRRPIPRKYGSMICLYPEKVHRWRNFCGWLHFHSLFLFNGRSFSD